MPNGYDKIDLKLKKYGFSKKCSILNEYSVILMKNGIDPNFPLPWELETFLMFSTKYIEVCNNDFKKNKKDFLNIISDIRKYTYSKFGIDNINPNDIDRIKDITNKIMIAIGSTQFPYENNEFVYYYRYNYFFNYTDNNIDFKRYFFDKFGAYYEMFLLYSFIIDYLVRTENIIDSKIYEYLLPKFSVVVTDLCLTREEFIKKIDYYSGSDDDFVYCIKPCNIYPFIETDDYIYLPLPHCVRMAITSSLCYRLTDGNNKTKQELGVVVEKYLYSLIVDSRSYDEVLSEREYRKGKNACKSSDVMCKLNNKVLFFECKSVASFKDTRLLDECSKVKEVEKIVKGIIELYVQLKLDFCSFYNFFADNVDIKYENRFGLVVLMDESYIPREEIYKKVNEKLQLSNIDFLWLVEHIKICDLASLEKFAITGSNIFDRFTNQNGCFDYFLSGSPTNAEIVNESYDRFVNCYIDKSKEILLEFADFVLQ